MGRKALRLDRSDKEEELQARGQFVVPVLYWHFSHSSQWRNDGCEHPVLSTSAQPSIQVPKHETDIEPSPDFLSFLLSELARCVVRISATNFDAKIGPLTSAVTCIHFGGVTMHSAGHW